MISKSSLSGATTWMIPSAAFDVNVVSVAKRFKVPSLSSDSTRAAESTFP